MTVRGGEAPAQVRAVQDRFKNWRKNKLGRGRIPQRLWAAAVNLCERHGVERVRRWLRLNYTALRARLERSTGQKEKSSQAFVEWVPTAATSGTEYIVERVGVTVRVLNAAVADVAALAKLLRDEEA